MKMGLLNKAKNEVEPKWPMIRVEHANPEIRDEIITLKEAARRFKLDDRTQGHLQRGEIAGTSVNHSGAAGRDIRTIWRYTEKDSVRDAASDLLEALQVAEARLRLAFPKSALLPMIRAAIKKALR
jgi:hypothetical protein